MDEPDDAEAAPAQGEAASAHAPPAYVRYLPGVEPGAAPNRMAL